MELIQNKLAENTSVTITLENTEKRKVGRPKGSTKAYQLARVWQSKGYAPLRCADVLAGTNERATWRRLLESTDDSVVLRAMMFLVGMRDGKPAQQINITSQSLNISAHDISEAKAIVAELRQALAQPTFALPSPRTEGEKDTECPPNV